MKHICGFTDKYFAAIFSAWIFLSFILVTKSLACNICTEEESGLVQLCQSCFASGPNLLRGDIALLELQYGLAASAAILYGVLYMICTKESNVKQNDVNTQVYL